MKKSILALLFAAQSAFGAYKIPDGSITIAKLNTQNSAPYDIKDCTIATSVGSNQLTIALKNQAGNDPSTTAPCRVAFRSSTLATGTYSDVNATSSTSLVVSSGATLGCTSGIPCNLYVYALNNAGTIELAVSGVAQLDEGVLWTSTTMSSSATAGSQIYSGTGRSSKAIRTIGRINITEATAGTWTSNATSLTLPPFPFGRFFAQSNAPGGTATSTTSTSFVAVTGTGYSTSRTLYGVALAGATANDYALKIAYLPAGYYRITATGHLYNSTNGFDCESRLRDITNNLVLAQLNTGVGGSSGPGASSFLDGTYYYSADQTNIQWSVEVRSTNGSGTCVYNISNGGSSYSAITVTRLDI